MLGVKGNFSVPSNCAGWWLLLLVQTAERTSISLHCLMPLQPQTVFQCKYSADCPLLLLLVFFDFTSAPILVFPFHWVLEVVFHETFLFPTWFYFLSRSFVYLSSLMFTTSPNIVSSVNLTNMLFTLSSRSSFWSYFHIWEYARDKHISLRSLTGYPKTRMLVYLNNFFALKCCQYLNCT